MLFGNPVRGVIHPPSWQRPTGNIEFRMTQDFGPTVVTAEPRIVWPGGEGIPAGAYAHFHQAIDLGNGRCGADVIAAAAGTVRVAGTDGDTAIRVIIDHGNGWGTAYWHLHDHAVNVGAKVAKGQLVGHVGSSGNSSACHLHFMVSSDVPWNNVGTERGFLMGKHLDPWRRLEQNVTVRPVGTEGVNIRTSAGSGSTPGPVYATTKLGAIVRKGDGANLGSTSSWHPWGGNVPGASYTVGTITGSTWRKIWLAGAWRFLAVPLTELSHT